MENNLYFHTELTYNKLDQRQAVIVDYVWLGGTGMDLRTKAKTYLKPINKVEDLDNWNYDGSSTYQAVTEDSEILLVPVALFNNPFTGEGNKIAWCETYDSKGNPTVTNFRFFAKKIFEKSGDHEPWFGIEQEYLLMTPIGTALSWPYYWPKGGYPKPQGRYYCSVGSGNNRGREIMNAHYKVCLAAGVKIFGTNAETMPGQWEFQIGTCKDGIEAGDHLWMGRYLLFRVAEYFNVDICFDNKPITGDWAGSGGHANYSTKKTRADSGMKEIEKHMETLKVSHVRLLSLYGELNKHRLTGKNETASHEEFSYSYANRGVSVRIPTTTRLNNKGYYEDRRPGANMDPYVALSALFSATCLEEYGLDELENHYKYYLKNKEEKGISN